MFSFSIFINCAKVYFGKLCSFELWKTTQIIHGHKAVRRLAELQNNTIFFGIGSSLKEMILNERFWPEAKGRTISMPGAKFVQSIIFQSKL
jgi:hypothetical protein